MYKYQFVVKNYRCFSDSSPARFVISRGMTGLLGVNNSGKSALLKMFQELRAVFSSAMNYTGTGADEAFRTQFIHVLDQAEVFCDDNDRDLSVEIEILGAPDSLSENRRPIKKILLTCSQAQNTPHGWSLRYLVGDSPLQPSSQSLRVVGTDASVLQVNNSPYLYTVSLIREMLKDLVNALYVGPFRNAITVGAGAHFDLAVGETFINTWNEWQNGPNKSNNKAVNVVTENIRRVMGFSNLHITASLQSKTLQLNIDNRPYKLNEVGSGLAQLVVVFGNALIRKPTIVFIDEPELNLHPRLQLEFLTNLASFASYGIVFATHSIGLARSSADRIYTVSRQADGSRITPYEKTVSMVELLGELSFSTYRELGAEKLLLVEGTTDVKVMQQLLRKVGKEHSVVVLPLGGNSLARGGVEHELAELKRVAEDISAVVDSEREVEGGNPDPARVGFEAICRKLGFRVLVTERRATENYFDDAAVKAALGPAYSALGPYQPLRTHTNGWSKAENWRIAQELNWDTFATTDLGKFIGAL
ncbi:ATP-dependent nuclease [Burkholderia seminalis]|uniref:ATP-dependent nuclease n=1 Tax=Burkholderia seminalis TaxID=488731 RepID=UPI0009E9074E|nr:AAA family ATPase [Burkholderia seminalis]